jgi:uncharacterized membrane protein
MKRGTLTGAVIAAAVASMFASGMAGAHPNHAKDKAKGVKCAGVNGCKGKGECGGADNACRGMNECRGQAWVSVASRKECDARGGKVVTPHEHKKPQ